MIKIRSVASKQYTGTERKIKVTEQKFKNHIKTSFFDNEKQSV